MYIVPRLLIVQILHMVTNILYTYVTTYLYVDDFLLFYSNKLIQYL